MFEAQHGLDTVAFHLIEQVVNVSGVRFIDGAQLIVGEKARPVDRGAVVAQPAGFHQRHVFFITVDEIRGFRRAVAVVPDVTAVFVPEIQIRILPVFLAAPALGLPRGSRGAEDKSFRNGDGNLAHNSPLCPDELTQAVAACFCCIASSCACSARREATFTNGR